MATHSARTGKEFVQAPLVSRPGSLIRQTSTLGARGFSCAVSGCSLCSLFDLPLVASAFDRHSSASGRFHPTLARKKPLVPRAANRNFLLFVQRVDRRLDSLRICVNRMRKVKLLAIRKSQNLTVYRKSLQPNEAFIQARYLRLKI